METIVASVISGLVAVIVCVISNAYQNDKTRTLIEYRLTELEKKQDKHNSVIERTYKLEQEVAVLTQKVEDME